MCVMSTVCSKSTAEDRESVVWRVDLRKSTVSFKSTGFLKSTVCCQQQRIVNVSRGESTCGKSQHRGKSTVCLKSTVYLKSTVQYRVSQLRVSSRNSVAYVNSVFYVNSAFKVNSVFKVTTVCLMSTARSKSTGCFMSTGCFISTVESDSYAGGLQNDRCNHTSGESTGDI